MKIGLSHPPIKVVRRIVSEDSKLQVSQLAFGTGVRPNGSLLVDWPFLLIVRT